MIRWTTREWELIARRLKSHHIEPQHHGWRTAVVEAMRFCLPAERWRAPHSLNESKKILGPLLKQIEIADSSKTHDKEEEIQIGKAILDNALEQLPLDYILSALTRRFAAGLLEELRAEIYSAVNEAAPHGIIPSRVKHDPCPTCTPRNLRPVVLVVGPKNGQQRELEERHGDHLELRFVASDENLAHIDKRGAGADKVVLWTNFISHAAQAHAQRLGKTLIYVTGGMSALHQELARIEK